MPAVEQRHAAVVVRVRTGWLRWHVRCPQCPYKFAGGKEEAELVAASHNAGKSR